MARTFRNTNSTPAGWTVRDNGNIYHEDFPDEPFGPVGVKPPHYRRSIYRCENKAARKATYNLYRSQVRDLMHQGRYDDIPSFRKTCGWNTW